MIDMEKARRESIRWLVLLCLEQARPIGASESLILSALRAVPMVLSRSDLHRELEYLASGGLVLLSGLESPQWEAKLTHAGIDVVEYTEPCPHGIDRPAKYW